MENNQTSRTMIKKVLYLMLAALLAFGACQKTTPITPPAPGDKTAAPEGQDDNGNGSGDDGSGSGAQTSGTLCTDIGQTPMVLAYYTENSSQLPESISAREARSSASLRYHERTELGSASWPAAFWLA